MNRGSVAVAFLHPGHYAACFAESMQDVLFYDVFGINGDGGKRRVIPRGRKMGKECGANAIVTGRNHLTRAFLDETDCEWLWWVDSDMGFAADTLERLVESADPITIPVVGALCFAQKSDGRGPFYSIRYRATPTAYSYVENDDEAGFLPMFDYPRDQLIRVAGTGAACLLAHRSALEKIRAQFGDEWFNPVKHPKATQFGEDLSFCVRLTAVGVPIYVNTSIKTTHDKGGVFFDEETYDAQQGAAKLAVSAA